VATELSWVNAIDTATTITSDSESATQPAFNLASARYGRVWRTSAATTAYFNATFAAATSINVLALAGCTLSATDTVRHRLYDTDGTTVLYDSTAVACGVLPGYALHITRLSQAYSPKYWRCDIVATSRASYGYFDIARAWAAPVWTPTIGISLPWEEIWEDDAEVIMAPRSGAKFVGDGPQYRTLNCSLKWLLAADKIQAKELARVAGRRTQVLLVANSAGDLPREAILGHITKMAPQRQTINSVPARYEQDFSITQDL
jgi:hypothetical protein